MMRDYLVSEFKLMSIQTSVWTSSDGEEESGYCKCEDCGIEYRLDTEKFYDIRFAGNKWRRLCTRCALATVLENNTVHEIIARLKDEDLKEAEYD